MITQVGKETIFQHGRHSQKCLLIKDKIKKDLLFAKVDIQKANKYMKMCSTS